MHSPGIAHSLSPTSTVGLAESGATLPKERGPVEIQPGRKAETDRVFEGISEGFRLADSARVAPRGADAITLGQAHPSRPQFSPYSLSGQRGSFLLRAFIEHRPLFLFFTF